MICQARHHAVFFRWIHTAIVSAVLCLLVADGASGQSAAPGPASLHKVFLSGNDDAMWAVQIGPPESGAENLSWFSVYQKPVDSSSEEAQLSFMAIPVSARGAGIAKTVPLADSLHLFYVDGTHRSIDVMRDQFWISPLEKVQSRLPENAIPLAIAEDRERRLLYAVVPGTIAKALDEEQARSREDASTNGEETNDSPVAEQEAVSQSHSAYVLLRYERGFWKVDREFPGDIDGDFDWTLAMSDGVCTLLGVNKEMPGSWLLLHSPESGQWDEPGLVDRSSSERVVGGLVIQDEPVFVLADADAFSVIRPVGAGSRPERVVLSGWDTAVPSGHGQLGVSFWNDRLAVLVNTGNGALVGTWNLQNGQCVSQPKSLDELIQVPDQVTQSQLSILPFMCLVVAMVLALTRFRNRIQIPVQFPEGVFLVSLPRRFLSFVIDCVVVTPFLIPVFNIVPTGILLPEHTADRIVMILFWISYNHIGRVVLGLTLIIIYSVVFEYYLGATVGKLLTRCRVTDEFGAKASFRAVLIRNLLKYIELFPVFQLFPSAVMLIWTPNSQRLGDVFAGTYVVETVGPEKKE